MLGPLGLETSVGYCRWALMFSETVHGSWGHLLHLTNYYININGSPITVQFHQVFLFASPYSNWNQEPAQLRYLMRSHGA